MKKILILMLVFALALTACGGPTVQETGTPEPTPTPTVTPTPTPEPEETWSPVYTDWSNFTPHEAKKPVYTRRYAEYTDTLIPSDDYGPLLSFAGVTLSTHFAWDEEDQYYDDSYLYGLVTLDGEVVVDPVFSGVTTLERRDGHGNRMEGPSLLVLSKTLRDENGDPVVRSALAAGDGSWVTDYLYSYDWEWMMDAPSFAQGVPLMKGNSALAFLDPDSGREFRVVDWSDYMTDETYWNSYFIDPEEGWVSVNLTRYGEDTGYGEPIPLLFDPQGNLCPVPEDVSYLMRPGEGLVAAQRGEAGRHGFVDTAGNWAIESAYNYGYDSWFENGAALVRGEGYSWSFIDREGNQITDAVVCDSVKRHGDYWYFLGYSGDAGAIYDNHHQKVDTPLTTTWTRLYFEPDGWAATETGDGILLARGTEVHTFPLEWGSLADIYGDRLLFLSEGGYSRPGVFLFADWDGNVIARWDEYSWGYFSRDIYTGMGYVYLSYYGEDGERNAYYDLDGNLVVFPEAGQSLEAGLLTDLGGYRGHSSIETLDGETVFYWPVPGGID